MKCYENALKSNPEDVEIFIAQSDTLYKQGKYDEAVLSCDKGLSYLGEDG